MTRQVGSHRRYAVTGADPVSGGSTTWFTTVPQHTGDIPAGTLRAIERDLEQEFGRRWLR